MSERPLSVLPPLPARPTVPTPPASYEAANAAAQARLDAANLIDSERLLAQWREAERVLDSEAGEGAS